jgi:heat shock protein HslJ
MKTRWIVALAAVAIIVAGCSSGSGSPDDATDGSGGELQGSHWVLDSYASEGAQVIVPDGLYADAEFTANRVKGFAGCSDYDALYRTGGRMLLVGMPAMTQIFCSEEINAFQSTYVALLQQSRFYSVRADSLIVRGPDRAVLLVFVAAPANPLLGSWVVESYVDATGATTAPLPDTELTVVFRLAKVSGSAGCNTFQGPYSTNGKIAAIGPLASTRLACAEDLMTQETAFLAALQGIGLVEARGQTLQLEDRSGSILVALARPSEPEPSASPSTAPIASASPSASVAPSKAPSAAPSATPKPTAKPTPTPAPGASASAGPTIEPPASLPPVATCDLNAGDPPINIATIVYPADWFTVTEPAVVACRYIDPAAIVVPADPATLSTAVMIKADPVATYSAALATATDPANWTVTTNEAVTISGLPATRIQATSVADASGFPVGVTRYEYLIDIGGFPVWIETSGTLGDPTFATNSSIVDLIASQSTFPIPLPAPN